MAYKSYRLWRLPVSVTSVISQHADPGQVSLSCLYLNVKQNVFPPWFWFWHNWVNGVMGRCGRLKGEQIWKGKREDGKSRTIFNMDKSQKQGCVKNKMCSFSPFIKTKTMQNQNTV